MSRRTRVCVYGVRTAGEALAVAEAGADAVGFVFHVESERFVEPEEAFRIVSVLPPFVTTVGLYTNPTVERYLDLEERCPTDYSQFHGNEPVDVVKQIGTRAIKTVWYEPGATEAEVGRWLAVDEVDAVFIGFLAAIAAGVGAWGEEVRRAVRLGEEAGKAVMLGGGIDAGNAAEIVRTVRPWAVGVLHAVEGPDGRKDPQRVAEFVAAVRAGDLA